MKFLQKYSENTIRFFIIIISVYTILIISPALFKATVTHQLTVDDATKTMECVVANVTEGGVSEKAGLQKGDTIIAINGKKVENVFDISNTINSLKSGEPAYYTVKRNGAIIDLQIFPYKYFHLIFFAFAVLGLGLFVNGFSVGISKPKELTSQLFFLLGIAAASGFYPICGVWYYTGFYNFLFWNYMFWNVMIFPMFLHFFTVYPIFYKFRYRKLTIFALYLYTILLQFFFMPEYTGGVLWELPQPVIIMLEYSPLAFIVVGIWLFLNSYRKIKEPEARKPLRILLIGLFAGLAGLIYYFVIFMPFLMRQGLNPVFRLPIIVVLAIPVTFGYSIFKYRILDTELILKRSIVFGIMTVFIIASYLFIISFLNTLFEYYQLQNRQLVTITTVIMIIFTFSYVNKLARTFVDRKFFRVRYNYRKALLNFSEELPYINDIGQVLRKLSATINDTMGAGETKVWICDRKYHSLSAQIPKNIADICSPDESEAARFLKGPYVKKEECELASAGDVYRTLFREDKSPKRLYDVNLREMNTPTEHREFIKKEKIVLSIPIMIQNDIVGTINFGEKSDRSPYSEEDIDLLKTIASQTAVVFENARLKNEEIQKNKIEEELNIAKNIQTGLLPPGKFEFSNITVSCSTLPARIVGGDFYDVIRIDDDKVLIVVADVSGKGIPAALYMAKVQAMIRFASKILKTPKEILNEVNKQVYEKFEKNFFVTVVLALFDLKKNSVKISRAGHNPVIFSNNGSIDVIQSKGMGLGLNKDTLFDENLEEKEIKLNPDSLLVLYTDGLNEAMNINREEFGMQRIIELMQTLKRGEPEDISSGILDEVRKFMTEAEQHDDITLVIVKSR